jgi:CheY-like chemotaxis protein
MHCHKILVVEDDDAIRATLIDLLASEGYEAVPAHHGKEALALLKDRKEDPCLILTDLMMPEMDGWELITFLKAQDIVITIPVVVMTAGTTDKVPHARKVIKKPFNLESVVALVKEHCGPPNGGPITKAQTSL